MRVHSSFFCIHHAHCIKSKTVYTSNKKRNNNELDFNEILRQNRQKAIEISKKCEREGQTVWRENTLYNFIVMRSRSRKHFEYYTELLQSERQSNNIQVLETLCRALTLKVNIEMAWNKATEGGIEKVHHTSRICIYSMLKWGILTGKIQ